jgi:hypothetical protein
MRDFFEVLQEEARARRAALRDDGEPLEKALARRRQEAILPPRRSRRWYLPAAGVTAGALGVMGVVFIDFEGRMQRIVQDAAHSASPTPSPPTFVLGDSPAVQFASARYESPVRLKVISTLPQPERLARRLKQDDPRLVKPTPGRWKQVTLRRLAIELGQRSGIPLSVAPELEEERVCVFAGEKTSVLQILRGVAHLYGSGWFRSKSGPHYRYTLHRFDTPETRGWLNALYQVPNRHAPGMDAQPDLVAPTHLDWLERLHKETGRTVISDDTGLTTDASLPMERPLFQILCYRAALAGQLWDIHAGSFTFRAAPRIQALVAPSE